MLIVLFVVVVVLLLAVVLLWLCLWMVHKTGQYHRETMEMRINILNGSLRAFGEAMRAHMNDPDDRAAQALVLQSVQAISEELAKITGQYPATDSAPVDTSTVELAKMARARSKVTVDRSGQIATITPNVTIPKRKRRR